MKPAFESQLQAILSENDIKMNQWQFDFDGDQATTEIPDSIIDQMNEEQIKELSSIK